MPLCLRALPIDTDAGDGPIKRIAHAAPISFYQDLVNGLLRGKLMLAGWKNMHPDQHYLKDDIDLFEHIDDPAYIAKKRPSSGGTNTRSTCRGAGICRPSRSSSRRTASRKGCL
jgi:hypothetical protein